MVDGSGTWGGVRCAGLGGVPARLQRRPAHIPTAPAPSLEPITPSSPYTRRTLLLGLVLLVCERGRQCERSVSVSGRRQRHALGWGACTAARPTSPPRLRPFPPRPRRRSRPPRPLQPPPRPRPRWVVGASPPTHAAPARPPPAPSGPTRPHTLRPPSIARGRCMPVRAGARARRAARSRKAGTVGGGGGTPRRGRSRWSLVAHLSFPSSPCPPFSLSSPSCLRAHECRGQCAYTKNACDT